VPKLKMKILVLAEQDLSVLF